MGKTKTLKKALRNETLKNRRLMQQGRGDVHLHVNNNRSGLSVEEVERREEYLRARVHEAEDAMASISAVTSGSRWKEAKEAHRIAEEFLSVVLVK